MSDDKTAPVVKKLLVEDLLQAEVKELSQGYYVYALIDPRDGSLFYIGKGLEYRVFAHEQYVMDKVADDKEAQEIEIESQKNNKIREILKENKRVDKIIIRSRLSEAEAFALESALIDIMRLETWKAHDILNIQGGHKASDNKIKRARDEALGTITKEEFKHNAIIINVNATYKDRPLYEAVRGCWNASDVQTQKCDIIIAEYKGIYRGVFKIVGSPLSADNAGRAGRIKFEAIDVSNAHEYPEYNECQVYMNKRGIGEGLEKLQGASNPIRYVFVK